MKYRKVYVKLILRDQKDKFIEDIFRCKYFEVFVSDLLM